MAQHTFSPCPHCHTLNKVDRAKALRGEAVCGKCGKSLSLHGLVSQVSADQLQKILRHSDRPVVVDFWASWCGPCKAYGPEFERASLEHEGVVFVKINTEMEPELSSQLGIRSIPCTILFKTGKEAKRQAGAMSAQQLQQWISS